MDERFLAGVKAAADVIQRDRVMKIGDRSEEWWNGSDEAESALVLAFPAAFPGARRGPTTTDTGSSRVE